MHVRLDRRHTLIAQIGIYLEEGYGQMVWKLTDLLGRL